MTASSSLPDAYLALVDQFPELHDEPHHPEHDCLLCERARRAFGYRRPTLAELFDRMADDVQRGEA